MIPKMMDFMWPKLKTVSLTSSIQISWLGWDPAMRKPLAPMGSFQSFFQTAFLLQPDKPSEDVKLKRIIRVEVGRTEKIPQDIKHLDASKQVAKHKFPSDRWERQPGCWIRVHNRPRRSMFIFTGTKDGPNCDDLD